MSAFKEWVITTEAGQKSADITTLKEQKYLQNRLFVAFEAGERHVKERLSEEILALKQAIPDTEYGSAYISGTYSKVLDLIRKL